MARLKRKYGRYRRFAPQKGTKSRLFLLLALRPQGVTFHEMEQHGITRQTIIRLRNEYGYIIQSKLSGSHGLPVTYYLRGRFYDKYRKQKTYSGVTNAQIERLQKQKKLTREDAKRLRLLREIA